MAAECRPDRNVVLGRHQVERGLEGGLVGRITLQFTCCNRVLTVDPVERFLACPVLQPEKGILGLANWTLLLLCDRLCHVVSEKFVKFGATNIGVALSRFN